MTNFSVILTEKCGNAAYLFLQCTIMCKQSMKDFVRAVTGALDYMAVLSFDCTLDNLVYFCTDPKLPSIATYA